MSQKQYNSINLKSQNFEGEKWAKFQAQKSSELDFIWEIDDLYESSQDWCHIPAVKCHICYS